jgi:hypothetical protein
MLADRPRMARSRSRITSNSQARPGAYCRPIPHEQESTLARPPNFKQEKQRREDKQRKKNEEKQRKIAERKETNSQPPKA